MDSYPPKPWTARINDLDEEEFRVIRAADGRPLVYIAKELSPNVQDDLVRLILRAPFLLEATRSIFFMQSDKGVPRLDENAWTEWRNFIGPVLSELWARWI